jgi:hypothetical protein
MQNLNNMWLVICDMRSALIKCCINPVIPCVPYAVTNVSIGTPGINGVAVTWSAPNFGTGQAPTSYIVGVYALNSGQPSGTSLINEVTVNFPTTSTNLVTNTLVPGRPYAVVVTAYYEDCGESGQAFDTGSVLLSSNEYCLELVDELYEGATITSTDCEGTLYPDVYRTASLKYLVNGISAPNLGPQILVSLKFTTRQNENPSNPLNTPAYINLTIPTGSYSASINYKHKISVYDGVDAKCEDVIIRNLSCVNSVSATSPEGSPIELCEANDIKICVNT